MEVISDTIENGEIENVHLVPIGDFKGSDKEGNPIDEHITKESLEQIADKLNAELSSKQFIEIYEKTDGEHSTREIAAALTEKCSHSKIALLWNKWAKSGIVIPAKQKGRYKAAFNLSEYGIASSIDESEE